MWGGQLLYDYVGSHIIISTPIGLLKVNSSLVTENDREAQATLPKLLQHAVDANLKAEDLVYDRAAMTGLRLRGGRTLVLPEGLLTQQEIEPATPAMNDTRPLTEALRAAAAAVAQSDLNEHGKK